MGGMSFSGFSFFSIELIRVALSISSRPNDVNMNASSVHRWI